MPRFTLYLVSNADGPSLVTLSPKKGDTIVETFDGYRDGVYGVPPGEERTLVIKGTLDPRTSGDDARTPEQAFADLLAEQWAPDTEGGPDRWRTAAVRWTPGPARFYRWEGDEYTIEPGYGPSPVIS